jgi:hypothetical protein
LVEYDKNVDLELKEMADGKIFFGNRYENYTYLG